jgi:hypothetical protein
MFACPEIVLTTTTMNSYLPVLNETKVLSPFDEALELQKQPLLCTQTNYVQTNTSTATIQMIRSRITNLLSTLSLMENHQTDASTTHLSLWSTKYRETNEPTVTEPLMIETIDFMIPSPSGCSTKPTIVTGTVEHFEDILYMYDGMTMSNWYHIKQQKRVRTQIILSIIGVIVTTTIVGKFIFV